MTGSKRQVEFYTDSRGKAPAVEFLHKLPPREEAQARKVIKLLEEFGTALGMPHARPIAGLWELQAGVNRLFYCGHTGHRFIILAWLPQKEPADATTGD